jgi:hypothetical protein
MQQHLALKHGLRRWCRLDRAADKQQALGQGALYDVVNPDRLTSDDKTKP